MNFLRSLSGIMEVELTSADLSASLTNIGATLEINRLHGIDDLTCRFQISSRQYIQLLRLAEKRGDSLKILRETGLYWHGRNLLKRPVLILGMAVFLMLTITLPSGIWFVKVEGNVRIPDRQIMEAAEKYGVFFGSSRRDVRSERVKNGVISEIPGLQWVGVNTAGCVATISVRERPETKEESTLPQVTRITADRDGYILSGTVVRGTPQFQVGQTVQKGQVLISGYTDCGFCIQAGRAEGEVTAQTNREITVIAPQNSLLRRHKTERKRKISLRFRKKRINLWKYSGIYDATCGRMYKEYYLTLPGGFRLPLALCVETYTFWDTAPVRLEQEVALAQIQRFSQQYLIEQMIAGTIREGKEEIQAEKGAFVFHGFYVCEEMIGREQPEQIGEANEKDS